MDTNYDEIVLKIDYIGVTPGKTYTLKCEYHEAVPGYYTLSISYSKSINNMKPSLTDY